MNARVALFLLCLPGPVLAQGFAGLGQDIDGFALPDPETRFEYPADHGAHHEFRIEWWYLTANLTSEDGTIYGAQWTLFRSAVAATGEEKDQVWMGHAAVSSPDGHFSTERFARGGIEQAGVSAQPFEAFIDEWEASGPTLKDIKVSAQGSDFAFNLEMTTENEFVPQGDNGYSIKSEQGNASHYYSQPFYEVTGTLTLPLGNVEVSGLGWLDREWSSQPLAPEQTGWDWTSLHLDTGDKLMAFRLRDAGGNPYVVGTRIRSDGRPSPIEPGEITMTEVRRSDVDGRSVPVSWDIDVPKEDISVRIEAIYDQSWMNTTVAYWEGPVRVSGSHDGVGYLEMTGYE